MIKLPVTVNRIGLGHTYLLDADGQVISPDQIVSALNAQEQATARIEELEPLIEACQGAVLVINMLLEQLDDFVTAKQLLPFPHPPLDKIKQCIRDAGGIVYETTEEAIAALAEEKK